MSTQEGLCQNKTQRHVMQLCASFLTTVSEVMAVQCKPRNL